jgi:hypothetical protein
MGHGTGRDISGHCPTGHRDGTDRDTHYCVSRYVPLVPLIPSASCDPCEPDKLSTVDGFGGDESVITRLFEVSLPCLALGFDWVAIARMDRIFLR